jgi:hypothetical protein
MHCPKCGQQQVSNETRFCSRCGFLLTGVAEVVANDGIVPASKGSAFAAGSPRRRGVMQGTFIFLLSFLVVPLIAMMTIAVNAEPFAVAIAAVLLTVGGLLRIAYALMFESGASANMALPASPNQISGANTSKELPGGQSIPVSVYSPPAGGWRDTNDLSAMPGSVTDSTTKLLSKQDDQ